MEYLITVFAGRNGLGQSWTYQANMPGNQIEECHAKGCEVIGLSDWCNLCDGEYEISAEHAEALIKVPGMVQPEDSDEASLLELNRFGSDKHRAKWPYSVGDPGFAAIYLAVAAHGAKALGLDLQYREADAYTIDACGEYYSAVV